jgi:N-acetylglucosaminyl-diphospho-decaprenol L-rhamnosyltransferase
MILSVIIVNYRVQYFLELCLRSVQKATQDIESEIIVIDNDSGDESLAYLRPLFPSVKFIASTENTGFARANNQALKLARGRYILFLNPDTILPENFVRGVLDFYASAATLRTNSLAVPVNPLTAEPTESQLDGPATPRDAEPEVGQPSDPGFGGSHTPAIGAIGVRMVDGSGQFLKESRRGFPSAWVAFCKLSGLTAVFPKSRLFSTYYLGYLPAGKTHPAPVLSGACFWVARDILEKTGGFDELFFMYAEDIDLSYRIEKAGYINYYLATTTIIHFKGESTRKDARYVKLFYKAMSQFRRKHFRDGLSAVFNAAMDLAIWLRAGVRAIALAIRGTEKVRGTGKIGGTEKVRGTEKDRAVAQPATQAHAAATQARATAIQVHTTATQAHAHATAEPPITTFLAGDPSAITALKNSAAFIRNRVLAETAAQAKDLILCEGPAFSFADCIKTLERTEPWRTGQRVKFYAEGNGSVLGSVHREGRGEVEPL